MMVSGWVAIQLLFYIKRYMQPEVGTQNTTTTTKRVTAHNSRSIHGKRHDGRL